MTTTELYALRSAQLKALCIIPRNVFNRNDLDRVIHYYSKCVYLGPRIPYDDPRQYATNHLSDKELEEIQTLADRYLEQIK